MPARELGLKVIVTNGIICRSGDDSERQNNFCNEIRRGTPFVRRVQLACGLLFSVASPSVTRRTDFNSGVHLTEGNANEKQI